MYPGMESCVGQMLPLLAIAVYKEPPVVSAHAVEFRLLLLSICAGTVVLGCTTSVWLTVDNLSAKVVEPAGLWPTEMMSTVAWTVASVGSLLVTKHCCNWDALTRASEVIVAGS